MSSYLKDIREISRCSAVQSAHQAADLPELLRMFEGDAVVRRLLTVGKRASAAIARELQRNGRRLPAAARTCLIWILTETDPGMASHVLQPISGTVHENDRQFLTDSAALLSPRHTLLIEYAVAATPTQFNSQRGVVPWSAARTVRPQLLADQDNSWQIRGIYSHYANSTPPADLELMELMMVFPSERQCRCAATETESWKRDNWFLDWEGVPFMGETCSYAHITNRRREPLGPTMRYNCLGFVVFPRRAQEWGGSSDTYEFFQNNCTGPLDNDKVRPGDIAVYEWNDCGEFHKKHYGRVWAVASEPQEYNVTLRVYNGYVHVGDVLAKFHDRVTKVRCKIDIYHQESLHCPYDQAVLDHYLHEGDRIAYYRQTRPLKGRNFADLFIKTHDADTGEQHCVNAFWESPDIRVVSGPFPAKGWNPNTATTTDSLLFGNKYRIWARVRNRGERSIGIQPPSDGPTESGDVPDDTWNSRAYIRYYWAYAGCPQLDDWNAIPEREVPLIKTQLGPFDVPGWAGYYHEDPLITPSVNAPYAEWSPQPVDPKTGATIQKTHLCFLAVVYAINSEPARRGNPPGDDPKNRCNPDPIIYPWEPAWDNNIAMRNVIAETASPEQVIPLTLLLGVPKDAREVEGTLEAVLTQALHLPNTPFPGEIVPLDVRLGMGARSERLVGISEHMEKGVLFTPDDSRGRESVVGGVVLPYKGLSPENVNTFDVRLRVPRDARPHTLYCLRIAQNLTGRIVSGCTIVIRVTK